jgi:hypothetical protein
MIQLPAYHEAMRDPDVTGTTRRMYDWCVLHLDVRDYRPIKRSVLPAREVEKLPVLVALGYLSQQTRPNGGENTYRLYWSRADRQSAA